MASVARPGTVRLVLLAAALITGIPAQFGGVASAGTVDIFSGPESGSNNIDGTNVGVVISPAWAVAPTGAEWISYLAGTGCNTYVPLTGRCTPGPQNPVGTLVTGTPTAIFYQTFVITDPSDSGTITVWADDTAGVYLDTGTVTSGDGSDGILEYAANPVLGTNCAGPQPVGCQATTGGAVALTLTTGTYTLVVDAYQLVGGSPFGVMYSGVLGTPSSTPEPASYMLLGLGLAGLGVMLRRKRRS